MSKISETGFWTADNAVSHHVNCKELSDWLIEFLKDHKETPLYDFGCGMGFYSANFQSAGFKYVTGFEGDPPEGRLLSSMVKQDLTVPFKVPAKGNCLFLEVAEHIPAELTEKALSNVLGTCDNLLIMSWAIKGQAGFGHVNCLDNQEAIDLIESKGFKYLKEDSMKARSINLDSAPWFRNTILIFKKV